VTSDYQFENFVKELPVLLIIQLMRTN